MHSSKLLVRRLFDSRYIGPAATTHGLQQHNRACVTCSTLPAALLAWRTAGKSVLLIIGGIVNLHSQTVLLPFATQPTPKCHFHPVLVQTASGMTMPPWQRMHTQKLTASSSTACCCSSLMRTCRRHLSSMTGHCRQGQSWLACCVARCGRLQVAPPCIIPCCCGCCHTLYLVSQTGLQTCNVL